MTRMSSEREGKREALENAMAGLTRSLQDLELVELRMSQARSRGGMHELLDPAIADCRAIRQRTAAARRYLAGIWKMEWSTGMEAES